MFRKSYSNSTALTLCLALMVPVPGVAQQRVVCPDGSAPPCAAGADLEDGMKRLPEAKSDSEKDSEKKAEAASDDLDSLDKAALVRLAEQLGLDIDAGKMKPKKLRAAIRKALDGQDQSAESQDAPAAQAVQPDNAEQQKVETAPPEDTETPEPAPEPEAEEPAAQAPEAAPEPEAPAAAQPEVPDETAEPTGESASQEEATDAPSAVTEDQPTPTTRPKQKPDRAPGMEAEEAPKASEAPEAEVAEETIALDRVTAEQIDEMNRKTLSRLVRRLGIAIDPQERPIDEVRTAVKSELGLMAPTESETVDIREETPPIAAGEAGNDGDGEVTTEVITEENSRSSDEEFDTGVIVDAQAQGEAEKKKRKDEKAGKKKDDGNDLLRDFGTVAAIGLGAIALNQILDGADEVVSNSGDRVVIRENGELRVLKNDDAHLRQPGNEVRTRTFADGSTRSDVIRPDGERVITVRAADGRVVRRVRELPDGTQIVLFDDTETRSEPVDLRDLPEPRQRVERGETRDADAFEAALRAELNRDITRTFSLRQVREIRQVRHLMPEIALDAVNFRTDSAVILPSEAADLADLGRQMAEFIARNPDEVFLVEGHTDTVGSAAYNLALSDRRAESVALALVEYFDVPPENLVVQGYGEFDLAVPVEGPERANRRATVRRITPLLHRSAARE